MSGLDVLVLAAHPDDAELGCGGWLALAGIRGQRAGVVDLTRGELGTNGTPEIRAAEAAAAAGVLGLAVRDNLGLPDGGVSAEDPGQLAAVVAAVRKYRPRLLVAPWLEARHPDHAATARLADKAMFFAGLARYRADLGAPFRPVRAIAYPERRDVAAAFVVDVTAVYDRKRAAAACHASQFGGAGSPTVLTGPVLGAEDLTAVRDRYFGATIGVAYGEPYLVAGPVPISDPLAHFDAHPATPGLVPR